VNKGTPFKVAEGNLGLILSAAFLPLFRGGSGVFCAGYKSELVEDNRVDAGNYTVAKFFGKRVQETSVVGTFPRPVQPLILYEFEGCPFCRKVREACSILDLDVLTYPCPRDGPTYRPEAIKKGGKSMFPYLEDPNTNTAMYESDDIIRYLYKTYGNGEEGIPKSLTMGFFTVLTAGLGLMFRKGAGSKYVPAKKPDDMKPIVLYGYEASPFVKVVRERLNELEIPHLYRHAARGSPKRQVVFEERGQFQVPFIEDPNTNKALFESADILAYLDENYKM